MADQHSVESSSTSNVSPESSESTVELKIKTLDSQMYNIHVDKNITVLMLKEKIASEVGVPVGQQRLIIRGKVLKDNHLLSEYHVENGHTLHLVARQVSEGQSSSGSSSSAEMNTNVNNAGQDANAVATRPRVAQHSVVLGTFGTRDQGDAGFPDISRVIGVVLNSINIGGQTGTSASGGVTPNMQFNVPQGSQTEGSEGNSGSQGQTGNQSHSRQAFPGQSMPQVVQIPLGTAIAVPSFNVPIPDSLNTLSVLMNRLEVALSQGFQLNQPSNTTAGSPPVGSPPIELPLNTYGLPTPASLATVLRHAERLFSGPAISSIAHIAELLELEEGSTDVTVRSQIQTESMHVGIEMHHLGALLLELGRTMLSLRIGQSSAESSVNAGPAFFISPSGANPMMVQPFPLQASSLFGGGVVAPPLNPGIFRPVGVAVIPRHVNIHIHAVGPRTTNGEGNQGGDNGTGDPGQTRVMPRNVTPTAIQLRHADVSVPQYLSDVGSRTTNGECNQGGDNGTGDPGQTRVVPRNVTPTAFPLRYADVSVSGGVQPSIVAEINSHLQNIVDNMQNESQTTTGQPGSSTGHDQATASNVGDGIGERSSPAAGNVTPTAIPLRYADVLVSGGVQPSIVADINSHLRNIVDNMQNESQATTTGQPGSSTGHDQVTSSNVGDGIGETSSLAPGNVPVTEGLMDIRGVMDEKDTTSSSTAANVESSSGGKTRQKSADDAQRAPTSSSGDGDSESGKAVLGLGGLQPKRRSKQTRSQGQSSDNATTADQNPQLTSAGRNALQSLASLANRSNSSTLTSVMEGNPSEGHGSGAQVDPANVTSQVMQSTDVFRNMLGQLTQNPALMNMVNQIAQQINTQDLGNMFSGLGSGQSVGLDLLRMIQRMMPIVSQALGGGSMNAYQHGQPSYSQSRPNSDEIPNDQQSQNGLQEVVQRIEHQDPSIEIFRSVVDRAVSLLESSSQTNGLAQESSSDEELANEFMGMQRRDVSKRV